MKTTKPNPSSLKRNIIRSLLGFFSISTMLFVFQACYGTPQDFGQDVFIEGTVKSASDNNTIEGIRVGFKNLPQYTTTNAEGYFSLYCPKQNSYEVELLDEDGNTNGSYQDTDTSIVLNQEEYSVFVNLRMLKDN